MDYLNTFISLDRLLFTLAVQQLDNVESDQNFNTQLYTPCEDDEQDM